MATIADLRARREALSTQRASGVARVSYDGKTVDYRSLAEIDRAIEALDRFMERAAQRNAQMAAAGRTQKAKRSRKGQGKQPPNPDELAAFYAAKVNSDEYLPASMISNAICEAMLARGLVTTERLRARGVL
jgi:phage shock protein A